jgi:hypothetical protein
MLPVPTIAVTRGRSGARRWLVAVPVLVIALGSAASAGQSTGTAPVVRENRGVYVVSAEFTATASPAIARATLTDYESIPRFMPEVRSSRVTERGDGYMIVEQEAVAAFMWFSKRIHLRLSVREEPGAIRFADQCGKSFARYEGVWTVAEREGRTTIGYHLTAQPSFEVPPFLLKRLLKRDAVQMIGRLQAEMAARAAVRPAAGPTPTDRQP